MSSYLKHQIYGSTGQDDVSIRAEIKKLFNNYSAWRIIRRMNLDANGNKVPCPVCKTTGVKGRAYNTLCDNCLGEGYIWTEEWIRAFSWTGMSPSNRLAAYKAFNPQGVTYGGMQIVYVEDIVKPKEGDRIIYVKLKDDGNPLIANGQYIRNEIFSVNYIDDYVLDNAKLEYFRLACSEESNRFFGQPLNQITPHENRTQ